MNTDVSMIGDTLVKFDEQNILWYYEGLMPFTVIQKLEMGHVEACDRYRASARYSREGNSFISPKAQMRSLQHNHGWALG